MEFRLPACEGTGACVVQSLRNKDALGLRVQGLGLKSEGAGRSVWISRLML